MYVIFVFSDWQLHTMITMLSHAGPKEGDANHSHPTSLSQPKGNCSTGLEKTKLQQFPSGSERSLEGRGGWGGGRISIGNSTVCCGINSTSNAQNSMRRTY